MLAITQNLGIVQRNQNIYNHQLLRWYCCKGETSGRIENGKWFCAAGIKTTASCCSPSHDFKGERLKSTKHVCRSGTTNDTSLLEGLYTPLWVSHQYLGTVYRRLNGHSQKRRTGQTNWEQRPRLGNSFSIGPEMCCFLKSEYRCTNERQFRRYLMKILVFKAANAEQLLD